MREFLSKKTGLANRLGMGIFVVAAFGALLGLVVGNTQGLIFGILGMACAAIAIVLP